MLTITAITTVLGALAGLVPAVLQFLSMKANNAQAIALRQLDIQAAREGVALQVDLARAQSDVEQQRNIYNFANQPSGVRWVDALTVVVRPFITLSIFNLWWLLKLALFVAAVNAGLRLEQIIPLVWTEPDAAMLGTVVGFWFGNQGGKRAMAATLAVMPPSTGSGSVKQI